MRKLEAFTPFLGDWVAESNNHMGWSRFVGHSYSAV